MYEYQPTIKEENFNDPQETSELTKISTLGVARSHRNRDATNQSDVQFCSVVKLWLETPGKKGPEDKALSFPHGDVPPQAPSRWHFAPKEETVKVCWELKGRMAQDGNTMANAIELKIELFTRNDPQALWTKTIKWGAGECPKRGETEFDGRLKDDLFKSAKGKTKPTTDVTISSAAADKFPEGILTVDQSPYKLKLSIVKGGELRLRIAKWIFFDILVDSLEVKWGDVSLLPQARPDITDPENLEKILGHKKDPNDRQDKDIKGYEEAVLDELKREHPQPTEGEVHKVVLTSNLFAFQERAKDHLESHEKNTDFESYKALWGNGARIPLLVKAFIKTSQDGGKTDKVPEALGNAKLLWDWEEKKPDRWKEPLNGGKAPKTEPFLGEVYKKNSAVKPVALSNCPKDFGGKLGADSADAHVFPDQPSGGDFPFEVKNCTVRKWSALSGFGTGEKRGTSGVVFQPSRMAGDAYTIKAYVHFDRDQDTEDDIQAPPPIQTKSFEFKVFRRIQLNSLVRGRARLNTDPSTLEATLKTDYLRELDMVVDVKQSNVDNNAYKAALLKGIERVCGSEHFVEELKDFKHLSLMAQNAIDINPPADSPGIVYRSWDDIKTNLERRFKNSCVRLVSHLSEDTFQDEEVTCQPTGAKAFLVKKGTQQLVISRAGQLFNVEQICGQLSQTVGQMTSSAVKSCWAHGFKPTWKTKKDDKMYEESIKVVFPGGEEVVVKYKKLGVKKGMKLSAEVPEASKTELKDAFARATNPEANSFDINIYARNDTSNARNRYDNLKNYLDGLFGTDTVIDRKALCEDVLRDIEMVMRNKKNQKMLALLVLGELIWEYASKKHPDDEGVFLMHVPGLYKGCRLPGMDEIRQPKVMGAIFPELTGKTNSLPFSTRNRAIGYLATVPDGEADLTTPTKTIQSIFKHELAHALFLPHSPSRPARPYPTPYPLCHVKGDSCLMNYALDTEYFCGMCMMRTRGWNWKSDAAGNRVAKVQILDGDDNTYLTAAGVQYVNLPAEDKWVDPTHTRNKHRLGRRVKIKVEFAQELAGKTCYVQLLAHKDNMTYSPAEKGRKPSFNFTQNPAAVPVGDFTLDHGALITGTTDANGDFITEVELSPAVGDRYKIVAWDDDDNRVESVEITTWRMVYYMTLLAGTVPNAVPLPNFCTQLETTFNSTFTKTLNLGHETIPGITYLATQPTEDYKTQVKARLARNSATTGRPYSNYMPFLAQICFGDMILSPYRKTKRVMGANNLKKEPAWTMPVQAPIGVGQPAVNIPVALAAPPPTDPTADMRKALWIGVGAPGSDADMEEGETGVDERKVTAQDGWFIRAIARLPNGQEINIPKANCTPVEQDPVNRPGYCTDVSVRVDNLGVNAPTATILLDVVVVNNAPLGQARIDGLKGYFVGPARRLWSNNPHDGQTSALLHEMGHCLGMVASSGETSLDPHPYQYNESGNHCHFGIPQRPDGKYNQTDPNHLNVAQCLMFGLVCNPPRMHFCDECKKVARKIDVSAGLL